VNLVAVIIAPIVVQYQDATGAVMYAVWIVGLALIGVLYWAVIRSKAPAPSMAAAAEAKPAPKSKSKSKKK